MSALDELEAARFLHREWEVDGVPYEKAREIVERLEGEVERLQDKVVANGLRHATKGVVLQRKNADLEQQINSTAARHCSQMAELESINDGLRERVESLIASHEWAESCLISERNEAYDQCAKLHQQIAALVAERDATCAWAYDSEGYYQTGCGQSWFFDSGTLGENNCRFCFYCGKRITETAGEKGEG